MAAREFDDGTTAIVTMQPAACAMYGTPLASLNGCAPIQQYRSFAALPAALSGNGIQDQP
jgi:hypothetical protein